MHVEKEIKTKCGKCLMHFLRSVAYSRGRTVSAVWYVGCMYFPLTNSIRWVYPCGTLTLLSIVLRYTIIHRHPYIDNAAMLSDKCDSITHCDFVIAYSWHCI